MDIFEPLVLKIPEIKAIASRESHIINECRKKKVLHVGCSDWPITKRKIEDNSLLHEHISAVACLCHGIDLSEEGVKLLRKHGFSQVICADAERCEELYSERFDIIVVGEVLEHVLNPGKLITALKNVLSDSGKIVITVPNAFYIRRLIVLLAKREVVHKDHLYYFSAKTLNKLLNLCGLEVELLGYTYPRETSLTRRIIYWPIYVLYRLMPYWGQCIVVHARRRDDPMILPVRPRTVIK